MTLYLILPSLFKMSMQPSFLYMFKNLLIWTEFLPDCAEALCEPLHHLFTQSLCYASLPRCWKIHKIVPVFKSGDSNCVENYRPISLLSVVSKVFERLIFNKIVDHISKSIIPSQFGFAKHCSALQQMLIFTDHIIRSPLQTCYLSGHQ